MSIAPLIATYWPWLVLAVLLIDLVVAVRVWRVAAECRRHARACVPAVRCIERERGFTGLVSTLSFEVTGVPDVLVAEDAVRDRLASAGIKFRPRDSKTHKAGFTVNCWID